MTFFAWMRCPDFVAMRRFDMYEVPWRGARPADPYVPIIREYAVRCTRSMHDDGQCCAAIKAPGGGGSVYRWHTGMHH